MNEQLTVKQAKFDYNFRAVRNIWYRRNKWIHEVTSTYEFSLDKIACNNFILELRKFNFNVVDNEVSSGIASKVIQEYTKVISPLLFNVKEDALVLSNHEEIAHRIKIKNDDLKLKPEYFTKVDTEAENIDKFYIIDNIGNYFATLVTEDGYGIANHHFSLDMMKFLIFCMQKSGNDEMYSFPFEVAPLDFDIQWTGKKIYDPNMNIVKYNGKMANGAKFFDRIKECADLYKIRVDNIDRENSIDSGLKHEIQFGPEKSDFEFSETKIKIKHNFYEYNETLYITAINNKNQ